MSDPYDCYRAYPVQTYRRKELLGQPHPRNVTAWKEEAYNIMVSYACNYYGKICPMQIVDLVGYEVTVWHPENSLISVSRIVKDYFDIRPAINALKVEVVDACLHDNSMVLPSRYATVHNFLCLDCGEEWGYDSSG